MKNPADENATIKSAFKQFQTYKQAIPSLFAYNGLMIISDGLEAKAGSISAGLTRFMAWKTADGKVEASPLIGQLETLIFDTFAASKQLLRQEPVQAEDRGQFKKLLKVASGGKEGGKIK